MKQSKRTSSYHVHFKAQDGDSLEREIRTYKEKHPREIEIARIPVTYIGGVSVLSIFR